MSSLIFQYLKHHSKRIVTLTYPNVIGFTIERHDKEQFCGSLMTAKESLTQGRIVYLAKH